MRNLQFYLFLRFIPLILDSLESIQLKHSHPTSLRLIQIDYKGGKSEKPSEIFLPYMAISDLNCSPGDRSTFGLFYSSPLPQHAPLTLMALDSCADGSPQSSHHTTIAVWKKFGEEEIQTCQRKQTEREHSAFVQPSRLATGTSLG